MAQWQCLMLAVVYCQPQELKIEDIFNITAWSVKITVVKIEPHEHMQQVDPTFARL